MEKNWRNQLFFGDNLDILRDYINDNTIDLIYLDPPFNSNATYNVLYKEKSGEKSSAQITAFEDSWHWSIESERVFEETVEDGPTKLSDLLVALRGFLGATDMMAYITMMAPRLKELYRVLKPSGTVYLHCDPTASHYLKLLMDSIFGQRNFLNEVIWCYKERERRLPYWNPKHDTLLFYCKDYDADRVFNWDKVTEPYSETTIKKFKYEDNKGHYQIRGRNIKGSPVKAADGLRPEHEKKHPDLTYRDYLEDRPGVPPRDWFFIKILNKASNERLGYPTQKPEELLEKLLLASSNEGDIVLDPFCGCGTTVSVAERLNRKWIGIDITVLAIDLIERRLIDTYGDDLANYEIHGFPTKTSEAKSLADLSWKEFELWACRLVNAQGREKMGADEGIDGVIYFFDDESGKPKKIIVQVKSGKVQPKYIRDLKGVLNREQAVMGAFITLEPPTEPMKKEAATAGFYTPKHYPDRKYPKIQIRTVEELLSGKQLEYPRMREGTFKEAKRKLKNDSEQLTIDGENDSSGD